MKTEHSFCYLPLDSTRSEHEQICDVQSGGPACEFLVRGSRGCRKSPREVPYPQRDRPQDGLAHPPRVRLYTSQLCCLGNSLGALSTRLNGLVGRGFERHRERREPRDCGLSARRHCRATSENGETRFEERVKDGNFFLKKSFQLPQEVYFLSMEKYRPVLFGIPLIVPCSEPTTLQDLYKSVWKQVSRLVSPLPPRDSATNHATDW